MNRETRKAVHFCALFLAVVYLFLFIPALDGYGYAGHGGFHVRSSRLYWGGAQEFHERSNRAESVDGPRLLGGGPESGK
jgi:hypothetical protein